MPERHRNGTGPARPQADGAVQLCYSDAYGDGIDVDVPDFDDVRGADPAFMRVRVGAAVRYEPPSDAPVVAAMDYTIEFERSERKTMYPLPHLRRDWAHPLPHLRRDWARPRPRLRRDWARPRQRLRRDWAHPLPRLRRDWAHPRPRLRRDWAHPRPRLRRDCRYLSRTVIVEPDGRTSLQARHGARIPRGTAIRRGR